MTTVRPRLVYFERWLHPVAERLLADSGQIEVVRLSYADPEPVVAAEMRTAHGYQVHPRGELREPWFGDAALLERCPELLALSSAGAGYDVIDVDACTAGGVIVCNETGTNVQAVAEHALGFMIALSKRIVVADRALRRGGRVDRFSLQGNDLRSKTLGIIGLGAIGSRLAELCGGLLGMQVLACDPHLTQEQVRVRGAVKTSLLELLQSSDFVSVHCPRTTETMGMLGAAEFAAMRPTAYFITTARGGIHDEAALERALKDGGIAGAGLDVFLEEPPAPDHPLLQLDTVIATPHTAGVTDEAVHDMSSAAAQQWQCIFSGQVPPRLVNPEVWPRYRRRFQDLLGFSPSALP